MCRLQAIPSNAGERMPELNEDPQDAGHPRAANPSPLPMLDYKSADAEVLTPRAPRRTVPKPFGLAFFSTAFFLAAFWLCVDIWNVWLPHAATYAVGLAAVVGIALAAERRLRLIAAGILIAAALWSLLLGTCALGTGWGVRPLAW
jgi:hypothetical protein